MLTLTASLLMSRDVVNHAEALSRGGLCREAPSSQLSCCLLPLFRNNCHFGAVRQVPRKLGVATRIVTNEDPLHLTADCVRS
jgi:hypothetical protein